MESESDRWRVILLTWFKRVQSQHLHPVLCDFELLGLLISKSVDCNRLLDRVVQHLIHECWLDWPKDGYQKVSGESERLWRWVRRNRSMMGCGRTLRHNLLTLNSGARQWALVRDLLFQVVLLPWYYSLQEFDRNCISRRQVGSICFKNNKQRKYLRCNVTGFRDALTALLAL